MRLFLERGLAKKFLLFIVAGQLALALRLVTLLVAIFRRFHPAYRDLRAGRALPPAIETPPPIILQDRRRRPEFMQLVFPAHRVALFRFRHPKQNAAPLFVRLVRGEVAINQRGFALRAPVGLEGFDRFGVIRLHLVALF